MWIGPGSPIDWPARSPNLSPLANFLWAHMKSLVYETPVDSEQDLRVRIMFAADDGLQGLGDRVYENMVGLRRYCVFVEVAGRHIMPFL